MGVRGTFNGRVIRNVILDVEIQHFARILARALKSEGGLGRGSFGIRVKVRVRVEG